MPFDAARTLIVEATTDGAFPAAVVDVGSSAGVEWTEAFGRHTYDSRSPSTDLDTVFDLASLTKVIAATTVVMTQVQEGLLHLSDPIGRWLGAWRQDEGGNVVTLWDALAHTAGLPDWLPLYRHQRGADAFVDAIARTPRAYQPRTRSVYSDLGFMLLGFIAERAAATSLDRLFDTLSSTLGLGDIGFLPPDDWKRRAAPTEYDEWRSRLLVGEVHDENAAALGGVAGHAGLFGTAAAVGRFARLTLRIRRGQTAPGWPVSPQTVRQFTSRVDIPGSSRALGWDTMLPTSSCGTEMSPSAFGHVGFTGTSLWLDPALDFYAVLLTNRVYPSRDNTKIVAVRPAFHDAVVREFKKA
ncbi:MAG: serine hydrolase domain-containing protein [Bacteroidales bacterium]